MKMEEEEGCESRRGLGGKSSGLELPSGGTSGGWKLQTGGKDGR
jgi:hypothetical protein